MTSLRERLERKIESESAQQNPMINGCLMYKAGAHSLVPLVLELAEKLDFYGDKNNWNESPTCSPYDSYIIESTDRGDAARKALQALEKFVGES